MAPVLSTIRERSRLPFPRAFLPSMGNSKLQTGSAFIARYFANEWVIATELKTEDHVRRVYNEDKKIINFQRIY